MIRFAIVSASRDDQFDWIDSINGVIQAMPDLNDEEIEVSRFIYDDNTKPLTTIYNDALKTIRSHQTPNFDFVIFLHADVIIDDLHFFKKIIESKYDLIGVAGGKSLDLRTTQLSWYNSVKAPEHRLGIINHEIDNHSSITLYTSPGQPSSSGCLTIDGVCMIMGVKAINSSIWFDEQFTFDFYDMDLSMEVFLNKTLKAGVEPLYLTHRSVGMGILGEDYRKAEKKFRAKWTDRLKLNHSSVDPR